MPPRTSFLVASLILALAASTATGDGASPTEDQARFFEAKVRPVLADHCLKCHGPDKQKAGLRLDSRSAAMAGGDTGPSVVAGKPEESPLVAAIRYEGEAKMPPSKKLPDEAVANLTRWVQMGAPWPGGEEPAGGGSTVRRGPFQIGDKDRAHWAFQPIRRPEVPAVRPPARAANPIDAFLLARLASKGLVPNPPATGAELIRRVTYDLTGLPPTPDEVRAYLADSSPDAYERLVDRLLASPHYGEKWGRHWLDLVRFAETNSYERDGAKPNAWRYRDYVVRSINADKPYDRFVREQLAGDELPDGGPDGLIATGYYRLGIWDDEPVDREQARYDGLDDLVATTGQVFLGLTIDCARCHDHKLDPIPQKDYYRLVSFFRNVNHYRNGGPTDESPLFDSPSARADHGRKVRTLEQERDRVRTEATSIEEEFRSKAREQAPAADLDDLRYRFYRDTWDKLPDFDALKPESIGKLPRPLFDLSPKTRDDAFGFVFEGWLVVPEDGPYTFHLDSDDGSRLAVDGKAVVNYDGVHVVGAEKTATVDLKAGRRPVRLDYFQRTAGLGLKVAWSGPGFGRRSLSASGRGKGPAALPIARRIEADGVRVLGTERAARYQTLKERLEAIQEEMVPGERALCVTESGKEPADTFVLLRGNPGAQGDRVEPAFLQVLGSPPPTIPAPPEGARTTGRRRVLADWIVSKDNPLTARVLVNRLWQHHFGRGIVRSSSNFGLQGDRPTHPELLDWLATEFLARGWRLKPIHRLILTSDAYKMSSRANPEGLAKDPANDLLWRFEMRRLLAEEVRDSILAASGNLNPKMFGPGVYPEIPAEVMAGQSMPGHGWGKSGPEEAARRSIYVHVKRSLMVPILESFDAAETDRSTPTRFATTQPTQALAMLNGPFLQTQAGILAARVRREAGGDRRSEVERALWLVTSRAPTAAEVARGLGLIGGLEAAGADPDDALASFCLVALNLDEFLYLD